MSPSLLPDQPDARPGPATVLDIARAAGVSLATVDRALRGRPGIAADTAERVLAAAKRLGWSPNPVAQSLSRRVPLVVTVLLPEEENPFLLEMGRIVVSLAPEFAPFRVQPVVRGYRSLDPASLAGAIRAEATRSGGLVVVALDEGEVRDAINEAVDAGVPVVTLLSDVAGCRRQAYVGMDNLVAGRTAGAMLEGLVKARNGAIAVFGGTSLYAELRQRVEGCREILETRLGGVQLLPTTWDVEHEGEAKAATLSLLAEEPELLGIYVAGGGLFGVADALIETGRAQSTVVVGHDLAGRMRALLLDRVVNVAICQDPVHQVRRAVRTAASLASGGKVEQSELLARVEIYIPESVVSAG